MADSVIELDEYYRVSIILDISLSPDGGRVAYVLAESDPGEDEQRTSVFVVPTDGSDDTYRLSRASDAQSPRWSPDGSKLGFIASRKQDIALSVGEPDEGEEENDTDGDAGEKPQVWAFDFERGGDARQLTEREEGVSEFDWSPDGNQIVVAARDPTESEQEYLDSREDDGPIVTERLQHKFDGQGWLDTVKTYLFVVDGDTREERRLDDAHDAAKATSFGMQPRWGAGGRIAYISSDADNPDDSPVLDVFTITPQGEDRRQLTDSTLTVNDLEWSPDGDRLAFVGGHPINWYRPRKVFVGAVEDGTYESVSGDLDRTVTLFGAPRWRNDETIICTIADKGWTRLAQFDATGGEPERVFDHQSRFETVRQFDLQGDTVAVALSRPKDGLDVYAMNVDALENEGEMTRLTETNRDLVEEYEMPECRRVMYENEDGAEIEGIAYLPDEKPDDCPLVVSIHGGPMSYDAPAFNFDHLYWTSNGYVVLCPNYRGSTSYGREFSEQLRGTRGDLESDDVISGANALVDRGWVDSDRMFVTGISYGGITSAHVATRTNQFAAIAPEHGIYDWRSTYGTDDNHLWAADEFGLPWEKPETYDEISSITDVDSIETPLLVTAGEEDWRCPPTQAEQLYVSVKKQGVPAKLVIYPGEHHNVSTPERAIHRLETLTEWFQEHDPKIDV